MGVLAPFFKNKNLKMPAAKIANPANFDAAGNLNSQNSRDSQEGMRETEKCEPLPISRDSRNSQPYGRKSENPERLFLEDCRISVEAIYARMDADRERRRDWWTQPVDDASGKLTLRNIARDETVVIDLRKGKAGR